MEDLYQLPYSALQVEDRLRRAGKAVMPESLFDETGFGSDTLYWDGSFENKVIAQAIPDNADVSRYVKVYEPIYLAYVPAEGVRINTVNSLGDRGSTFISKELLRPFLDDSSSWIDQMNLYVISVTEKSINKPIELDYGFFTKTITFQEPGLYLQWSRDRDTTRIIDSVHIPGFVGFPFNKIKPELLPDNVLTSKTETWSFELDDGTVVEKVVCLG